jgi:UDP-glucuronate decarboxylase
MANGTKRILVTGGAGFLGSHLCDRLIGRGDEVTCLDDFSTGSEKNIQHLLPNPRFTVIRQDVTMPLRQLLAVDEIYNLACPASPVQYQNDPVQTIKTNVHGAINMLDLARETGAKIFQASTSEVYGDPEVHPQPESYWGFVNPVGLRSCYDEGKRCAETLFFDYFRQHQVRIKVARIFNTYGPRMHPQDGRVVSNFIVQALQNKDITIYGKGTQTRSFCYVSDLIEAMIRFMDAEDAFTGPVNIGNPDEVSVGDLAERICQMTGASSGILYMDLPGDDPRRRQPDIALATAKLGWRPATSLHDGLERTIAHFRDVLPQAGDPANATP